MQATQEARRIAHLKLYRYKTEPFRPQTRLLRFMNKCLEIFHIAHVQVSTRVLAHWFLDLRFHLFVMDSGHEYSLTFE